MKLRSRDDLKTTGGDVFGRFPNEIEDEDGDRHSDGDDDQRNDDRNNRDPKRCAVHGATPNVEIIRIARHSRRSAFARLKAAVKIGDSWGF